MAKNEIVNQYYNLFDETKGYTEILFRAGKVLQSKELNEMQSILKSQITNVGNIKVDVKAESSKGYETLKLSNAILKVVPKEIFVTVDNKEKMIGEKDPELTYSYDEKEIYDDDVKEAVKNLKIYRKLGETAGNYEVTLESIEFENYVLKIKNGNLEIKELPAESKGENPTSNGEKTANPKTFDSIDKYYLIALISLLGFVVITRMKKRRIKCEE
jgi:hypothetical protein